MVVTAILAPTVPQAFALTTFAFPLPLQRQQPQLVAMLEKPVLALLYGVVPVTLLLPSLRLVLVAVKPELVREPAEVVVPTLFLVLLYNRS